jgi:hypothetical protein
MTPQEQTPGAGLVDGVDVDAVAAVVASCPGVAALDGGRFGEVASYLPGRVVQGVAVDGGRVRVQVRSQWGVPVPGLAALITTALAPLAGMHPVDVAVADIDDPPAGPPAGGRAPRPGRRQQSVTQPGSE